MNGKRGALLPLHAPLPIAAERLRQTIPDRLPTHTLVVDGRRPSSYPHYETLGDALAIADEESGSTYHIHLTIGHTHGDGRIVGPNTTIISAVDSDVDGIVTNYGEFEGIGDVYLAGNNYGSIRAGGNVTVCGMNEGFIQLGNGNVSVGGNNTGAIFTTGTVMIGKNDPGTIHGNVFIQDNDRVMNNGDITGTVTIYGGTFVNIGTVCGTVASLCTITLSRRTMHGHRRR